MNKKKTLFHPKGERFTMLPPMKPNFSPPGSENWPVAVRPEIVQPTTVAGSPPTAETPSPVEPAADA